MITVLTGDNTYQIDEELRRYVATFEGEVERYDGDEMTPEQLADIGSGMTLFARERCVVISQLSTNKSLWSAGIRWFEQIDDDTQLILVELSVDKRTKTYKWLQKNADIRDFAEWSQRDSSQAAQWVTNYAAQLGAVITRSDAQFLVRRVGAVQWRLARAVEKLALLPEINETMITQAEEARPEENVFALFETALKHKTSEVIRMIETLRLSEDGYRVFGLLSSQALQLAALASTTKPSSEVAREIGAHPYVLSKLASYASHLSASDVRKLVEMVAKSDDLLKSSSNQPWLVIQTLLVKVAQL